MIENKPWYASTTIWGTVVTLVALVSPKIVAALGGGDVATDTLVQVAQAVAVLVGVVVTVWGRAKAQGPLTK
jgi:hypothetical protein